jgi:hypothetical protein
MNMTQPFLFLGKLGFNLGQARIDGWMIIICISRLQHGEGAVEGAFERQALPTYAIALFKIWRGSVKGWGRAHLLTIVQNIAVHFFERLVYSPPIQQRKLP